MRIRGYDNYYSHWNDKDLPYTNLTSSQFIVGGPSLRDRLSIYNECEKGCELKGHDTPVKVTPTLYNIAQTSFLTETPSCLNRSSN